MNMERRRTFSGHGDSRQAKRHKPIAPRPEAPSYDRYTVAWICALHIEMAAARAMLDEQCDDLPRRVNDTNSYVLGTMHRHNVVIACLPADQYGTNNAASVLSNMKSTFPNIKIGLMVGIGGGVPTKADIRLGDIVVGIRVMQFDLGKMLSGSFERTAIPKIPDSSIRTVISNLRSEHELRSSRVPMILEDKMNEYPAYCLPDEPDRLFQSTYSHESSKSNCGECDQSKLEARKIRLSADPVIHYGAIASGNQVMKDAASRDDIARELDVICFEMEAAGLMDIMPCLPIRGICDYSDSHKSKEWQRYAAATAAAYAYEFLEIWGEDTQSFQTDHLLAEDDTFASPERRERLLEYLDFQDIDSRKITIKAAYSKTCQWFLKHPDYLCWKNSEEISRHHGFLWIKGKPGAGKSTIMKFLYSRARKRDRKHESLTGSFFFNARGAELEKTVSGMYRSLLLQLLKGFPDLQCVLDDPELLPPTQAACPSINVLKDLFRSAVLKLGRSSFTCYIDALDECDEQQVMDMVGYFEDLAEECTENRVHLQICFSSRHYPFVDIKLGLCLILEEQAGHIGDLETYIKTHLRVKDPALLTELQERMLEKAAGVFMWVVLVVEVLNAENRRGRLLLKTRLEEVPSGLSELFKDLLRRDKTNMEELLLSIMWILLSERPLKPEEYYHALWSGLSPEGLADLELPEIAVSDANDCFNRCVISSSKGLAEITKAKHPTVQFIHESVRDFLIKDRGLHDLWPELGADWESSGHERLKLCCHSYVKAATQEQLPPERIEIEKTYPFLKYANRFILHHADHASNTVCQERFLSQFLTSAWISIANIFEKLKIRRYTNNVTLLYILADRGHSALIRTLLKAHSEYSDVNLRVTDGRCRYPLIAAMYRGHKECVVALLGLSSRIHDGIDITATLTSNIHAGNGDHTPFSWACGYGHFSIVKMLISRHGGEGESRKGFWTPLMCAANNGHADIVKLLIDNGVDIHTNIKKENAMSLAIKNGHEGIVKLLLDAGVSPNYSGVNGYSLLCLAANCAQEELVMLLLKEVAIPNRQNPYGKTALHYAAATGGTLGVIKQLLSHGADVHVRDNGDQTCLMLAAANGSLEEAKLLIKSGADVNARDQDGRSSLHMALRFVAQPYAIVRLFLDNGADVNSRDLGGRMCLHEIGLRYNRFLPSLDLLLAMLVINGVDINACDDDGNTPLHFLYNAKDDTVCLFLNQNGVDVNAQNHQGQTPLHLAAKHSKCALATKLIDHGADVNCIDNKGQTPLDCVGDYNGYEVSWILIENGGINGNRHFDQTS